MMIQNIKSNYISWESWPRLTPLGISGESSLHIEKLSGQFGNARFPFIEITDEQTLYLFWIERSFHLATLQSPHKDTFVS